MADYWCKVDLRFLEDDKTEEIGERFGPAGPLAMLALLLGAKAQNRGGKVDGTYRNLAHDVWVDRAEIEAILKGLIEVGFAEGELNGRYFKLSLPSYKRWNERIRKQEQRDRRREEEECPGGVPTCPEVSEMSP